MTLLKKLLKILFLLFLGYGAGYAAQNTVTLYSRTGAALIDRPVSIPRAFKQGDIPGFAKADVPGVTQCDVKNRWPDGSLKFAVVSFVVPSLPAGGVTVSFSNQGSGNNAGHLSDDQLKDDAVLNLYGFNAAIQTAGSVAATASAREMLKQGRYRYWLQGPIVTAVIIEDRDPALPYDTSKNFYPLHPIFEAWFYPDNKKVDTGYVLENMWASGDGAKSMRDVNYSLTLTAGGATVFTHPSFTHIGKSRWHKRFWVNGDPGRVFVDHNVEYMASARVIPNYDTSIRADESLVASRYSAFDQNNDNFAGNGNALGSYKKDFNGGGAADWIGLLPTWDTLHLLNMDAPDERLPDLTFGNADLAGRMPMHFRERDVNAGTGQFFDSTNGEANGSVDTFGRVVSVNARRQLSLWDLDQDCGGDEDPDLLSLGSVPSDGWDFITRDHMPDPAYLAYLLSGRYYYLDELQQWSAYVTAHGSPCYTGNDRDTASNRQGHNGFLNDSQLRGDAWGLRTLVYGAFLSPDGTPEKAYFDDKLANNIAEWEGEHDVPLTDPSRISQWTFGRDMRREIFGSSPLGAWRSGGAEFIQAPLRRDGTLSAGNSPWEENFFICAMGMAKQFGYPVNALMRFLGRRPFNIMKNPATIPYLIEAYRYPTITSTNQWVSPWSAFDDYYSPIPSAWFDEANGTIDHSYGYIALSALSFLYPYTADGIAGADAWDTYFTGKGALWRRGLLASQSPKWSLLPNPDIPPDAGGTPSATPARPRRLRVRP